MVIRDIINDVASRLSLSDEDYSDDCYKTLDKRDLNMILNGIKRLFDRFSIDDRKLPSVCEFKYTIKSCDTKLSIGKDKDFNLWAAPNKLQYAAWSNKASSNKINCCDDYYYGLCDQPIHIREDDGDFHFDHFDKDQGKSLYQRPSEIFYQRNGEIVFSSPPRIGDVLILRATMPFKMDINSCGTSYLDKPMYEFDICPSNELTLDAINELQDQAVCDFDGCENWSKEYYVDKCGAGECDEPLCVTVSARKVNDFCPEVVSFNTVDLPAGYYSAIVHMLNYELAGFAKIEPTQQMQVLYNEAKILLHRRNERTRPKRENKTTPWSRSTRENKNRFLGGTQSIRGKHCG